MVMPKDLECPYCNHEQDVCHDDGFGYEQDELHEVECRGCGKYYGFRTTISFSYEPVATPCLNGELHEWKQGKSWSSNGEIPRWDCVHCEARVYEKPKEYKAA